MIRSVLGIVNATDDGQALIKWAINACTCVYQQLYVLVSSYYCCTLYQWRFAYAHWLCFVTVCACTGRDQLALIPRHSIYRVWRVHTRPYRFPGPCCHGTQFRAFRGLHRRGWHCSTGLFLHACEGIGEQGNMQPYTVKRVLLVL